MHVYDFNETTDDGVVVTDIEKIEEVAGKIKEQMKIDKLLNNDDYVWAKISIKKIKDALEKINFVLN